MPGIVAAGIRRTAIRIVAIRSVSRTAALLVPRPSKQKVGRIVLRSVQPIPNGPPHASASRTTPVLPPFTSVPLPTSTTVSARVPR
jgi:hypothetical protein